VLGRKIVVCFVAIRAKGPFEAPPSPFVTPALEKSKTGGRCMYALEENIVFAEFRGRVWDGVET